MANLLPHELDEIRNNLRLEYDRQNPDARATDRGYMQRRDVYVEQRYREKVAALEREPRRSQSSLKKLLYILDPRNLWRSRKG